MQLAEQHSFLLFEDRKLADIGNTVRLQADIFIRWADLGRYYIGSSSVADPDSFFTNPDPGIFVQSGSGSRYKKNTFFHRQ